MCYMGSSAACLSSQDFCEAKKKENKSVQALEITTQCKDAKGNCCCTELDPNRQPRWVPALVINGGMKDFIRFFLPYQGSSPGKELCTGKREPSVGLLPTPCVGSLEHYARSQEPGRQTPSYHKQAVCPVHLLASLSFDWL